MPTITADTAVIFTLAMTAITAYRAAVFQLAMATITANRTAPSYPAMGAYGTPGSFDSWFHLEIPRGLCG